MNILRWNRKSKNNINPKKYLRLIVFLIFTTFAWFTYSKVLEPTLKIHMVSWDIEYYIENEKKTNPINIDVPELYPAMPEHITTIDILNNGETSVDLEYQVKSISIAGTTYEIVQEGEQNTSDNYILIASPVLFTDEETGEEIYKSAIIRDTARFPFTIDVEYSAQLDPATEDDYGTKVPGQGYLTVTVNWVGDNDVLDSEWGYKVGKYLEDNPSETSALSIVLSIDSYQTDLLATTKSITMPLAFTTKPYLLTGLTSSNIQN